jgi:hypothetical protein
VPFLVGIGLMINARWFTLPAITSQASEAISSKIVPGELSTGTLHDELAPSQSPHPSSITQGTTRQLK